MGKLIPVWTKEMLPGDKFTGQAQALQRLMPMVTPPMHKMQTFFHAFFVPYRLLWPSWEKFITGGQMGDVPPALPVMKKAIGDAIDPSSLDNYLGLPVDTDGTKLGFYTAFRHAAYQRIWHDWYRDQNLQNVDPIELKDGDNAVAFGGKQPELETLRSRAWEHDYFTSCLPFAQKGAPVGLPIDFSDMTIVTRRPGSTADNPFNPRWLNSTTGGPIVDNPTAQGKQMFASTNEVGSTVEHQQAGAQADIPSYYDPQGSLIVSGAGASSVNDLRAAMALQRWLEKNARGGTRYCEALRVHFGVISSDARLQRAEYLGGSKSVMAISEVLQTSATEATSAQGNMAGHGVSITGGNLFSYRAEEHGQIMIIMSMVPETSYFQGIPREFLKKDRLDFYFAEFASLGEQEVFNKELVVTGLPTDDETFGYLPRFAEYRVEASRVSGQMATTLLPWHLAREFSTAASVPLNEDFIVCDPSKRIFAVTDPNEDEMIIHIMFKIFARRPLPAYGTPL